MGFLIRLTMLLLGLSLAVCAHAKERALLDFTFNGYVQGRFIDMPNTLGPLDGLLTTGPEPNLAGGDKTTQAAFKRLVFYLGTTLPWEGWKIQTSTHVTATKGVLDDAYLAYAPDAAWTWKLGQFRVPFGQELQISSSSLDTPERSLLYGFGNFGWQDDIGLHLLEERSLGARLDWSPASSFASFRPFGSLALVSGNAKNTGPTAPLQAMARLGADSSLAVAELRHALQLGASLAYGRQKFLSDNWDYLPIGATGNTEHPSQPLIAADPLSGNQQVLTLGFDGMFRVNEIVLKAEWASRQIGGQSASGYYVTGIWELADSGFQGLEAVARWEEAKTGYADGVHFPDRSYQAATLGCNWQACAWLKFQLDYLVLYLDRIPHLFPGSDIVLLQTQVDF